MHSRAPRARPGRSAAPRPQPGQAQAGSMTTVSRGRVWQRRCCAPVCRSPIALGRLVACSGSGSARRRRHIVERQQQLRCVAGELFRVAPNSVRFNVSTIARSSSFSSCTMRSSRSEGRGRAAKIRRRTHPDSIRTTQPFRECRARDAPTFYSARAAIARMPSCVQFIPVNSIRSCVGVRVTAPLLHWRPGEPAALQPLGHQAQPGNLSRRGVSAGPIASTEDENVAGERIGRQRLHE